VIGLTSNTLTMMGSARSVTGLMELLTQASPSRLLQGTQNLMAGRRQSLQFMARSDRGRAAPDLE
jgi:hypothetical protein